VVGAAAVFCLSKTFKVVRQGDVAVVERLGKFRNRLDPGLHVIVPFIDQVRGTLTTREQVFDIPPQKCITSDNAPLSADAVVYWGVVDPYRALYSVVNLEMAIQNLVLTQLRAEIGKLTLDMTFSAREQINAVLLQDLDVATAPWGIKISRVEGKEDNLRSITPRLHGLTFVRSITKFETLFQTARL
jgi:regulator of protease activity HflC (stomatin/prohibitin superfamily)